MACSITEYASFKSPVVSVKLKERGFSYEKFKCGGSYASEKEDKYDYASVVQRISSLIEGAFDTPKEDLMSVISKMLDVRKNCGERFPVLARQICDWICDLVLICGETDLIPALCKGGLSDIPFGAEFLVYDYFSRVLQSSADMGDDDKLISALRCFCTYDFASSGIYRENRELYRKVLQCALPEFMEYLKLEYGEEIFSPCVKKCHRTSFGGLTCSARCIRMIEIEYLSFSECERAIEALTGAVRYCDNLVRQSLCVNSRLTGISLSAKERKIISDAVRSGLPGVLPPGAKVGRKPGKNAGAAIKKDKSTTAEKVQEPVNLDVDFGKARELLEKSWLLSELFDSGEEDTQAVSFGNEEADTVYAEESVTSEEVSGFSEWEQFVYSLSDDERKVLECILYGGDVTALSRSFGGMPYGFADVINEKALDAFGDVVIEINNGGALSVFEDYRAELSEIMNKNTGGDINV